MKTKYLFLLIIGFLPVATLGSECGPEGAINREGILKITKECDKGGCAFHVKSPKVFEQHKFYQLLIVRKNSDGKFVFSAPLQVNEVREDVESYFLLDIVEPGKYYFRVIYRALPSEGCALVSEAVINAT